MIESLTANRDFVRTTEPPVSWQTAMKRAIRSGVQLCKELELEDSFTTKIAKAEEKLPFPVFVPLEFLARMERGNPHDPLLRQVLPVPEELEIHAGFSHDPVGEVAMTIAESNTDDLHNSHQITSEHPAKTDASVADTATRSPLSRGILKKYHGRALVMAQQACGIHCRYCFRRHFPYSEIQQQSRHWEQTLDAVAQDSSLNEIILSGGDPLVLTDRSLRSLIEGLEKIPHVSRLRIHSRMPIVIPQRVTEELIQMLSESRLACWMAVHTNHPAELDRATLSGLQKLVKAGVPVLNQAVLLKGVNDEPRVLESLCRKLIDARIQPYYLHQLDRVSGAAHFEVDERVGLSLMQHLRDHLPGYGVPKYVREIAGEGSKHPLN